MTRYLSGLPYKYDNYIYIIKCGIYYKIGRTSRMGSRMTDFRVNNPYDTELIHYTTIEFINQNNNVKKLEKELHKIVEEQHHRGEWFILNDKQVNNLINNINSYGKKQIH